MVHDEGICNAQGETVDDLRRGCAEHNAGLVEWLTDHLLKWVTAGADSKADHDAEKELHRQTQADAKLGRVAWPRPLSTVCLLLSLAARPPPRFLPGRPELDTSSPQIRRRACQTQCRD